MLLIQLPNLADVEKPLLYGLRSSSAYGKLLLKEKVVCSKREQVTKEYGMYVDIFGMLMVLSFVKCKERKLTR